jgi:dienelactone hydrolase
MTPEAWMRLLAVIFVAACGAPDRRAATGGHRSPSPEPMPQPELRILETPSRPPQQVSECGLAIRALNSTTCSRPHWFASPPRFEEDWENHRHDALSEIQVALGHNDAQEALRQIDALEVDSVQTARRVLGPIAAMWMYTYRGVALDQLARREEAVEAYRTAIRIHRHEAAEKGVERPMKSMPHLRRYAAEAQRLSARARYKSGCVEVGGRSIRWVALVPKTQSGMSQFPLVVRVGHPRVLDQQRFELARLERELDAREPVAFLTTDVLALSLTSDRCHVDDAELLARVPSLFDATLDNALATLPIDRDRIYLTGFSFDGVWAWILGFARPDQYAAIAPLSAVSYPGPISGRPANGTALPVCALRGARDHMYPGRRDQEEHTGREMTTANPNSVFRILPDVDHGGVSDHSAECWRWLLGHRRERWPTSIDYSALSPEERGAYWATIQSFAHVRAPDWTHTYGRLRARIFGDTLRIDTENVARVRIDLRGAPFPNADDLQIMLDGAEIRGRLPGDEDGPCAVLDVGSRTLTPCAGIDR